MDLEHDTSPHDALTICEISSQFPSVQKISSGQIFEDKGNNSIVNLVMDLVHDTPPHDALSICEVSNQLILWSKRYPLEKYFRTESRKDGQAEGRSANQ